MHLVQDGGRSVLVAGPSLGAPSSSDARILSAARLSEIDSQLCAPGVTQQETLGIAKQVLAHALASLEDDSHASAALSAQFAARSSAQAAAHALELANVEVQARALARKLVSQARPRPPPLRSQSPPDDFGRLEAHSGFWDGESYTEESEVDLDNRRLKADVRFLKTRLRDSEGQAARLEAELRKLRSHLLTATPLIATDAEVALSGHSGRRQPTMGDAEAELLLAAGKSISHVRRIHRVPLSEAIALQAYDILNVHVAATGDETTPRQAVPNSPSKPPPPRAVPGTPTTPRRSTAAKASTTPSGTPGGGSGMDELLFAAQSVLVPSSAHAHSAKRRKLSPSPAGWVPSAGDALRHLREPNEEFSALDLLAQASSSQESQLGPSFEQGPVPPPAISAAEERFLPGPVVAVKGARSPYQRWNISEDQLLVQAVLLHGQRWDLIAAMVPTRSYHQCRQRWLRGLKNGDALPEELIHLQPAVKKSLREFIRNKEKNAAGGGGGITALEVEETSSGGGE